MSKKITARKKQSDRASTLKSCFVISPIGEPGSEIREHADDVLSFIIDGAMERTGYEATRGDHETRPGKISDQMFDSILNHDLIICVLAFQNPNVYYEMAVAHAAARPVIILCEKGQDLPFDVKDQRVIYYDLRPRPLFEKKHEDMLVNSIRALEGEVKKQQGSLDVPFASKLSPLGKLGEDFEVFQTYTHARTSKTASPVAIFQEADRELLLCGLSLKSWQFNPGFEEIVKKQAETCANIRVMMMHQENSAISQMLNNDVADQLSSVKAEIKAATEFWQRMSKGNTGIQLRKIKTGIMYQQIVMNENRVLYTPYSYAVATGESLTLMADNNSHFYHALKREFDYLWMTNKSDK